MLEDHIQHAFKEKLVCDASSINRYGILVMTPLVQIKALKKSLKTDPVVQNMHKAIQLNAAGIYSKPLLKRELEGRRLLGVSREMLYRINMLGMVYLIPIISS